VVYDHWLFDVPKMIDIACLYAETNAALTRDLLQVRAARARDVHAACVQRSVRVGCACGVHRARGARPSARSRASTA
jgi:hypothetical protein